MQRMVLACRTKLLPGALLALATAASLAFSGLSLAQQAPRQKSPRIVNKQVKAAPGQAVRIAVFAALKPDCTSGPLPTVRLTQAPEKGRIVVRRGKLRIENRGRCLSTEVPAVAVFYRTKPDASGTDTAALTVVSASGSTLQLHHYSITITAGTSL